MASCACLSSPAIGWSSVAERHFQRRTCCGASSKEQQVNLCRFLHCWAVGQASSKATSQILSSCNPANDHRCLGAHYKHNANKASDHSWAAGITMEFPWDTAWLKGNCSMPGMVPFIQSSSLQNTCIAPVRADDLEPDRQALPSHAARDRDCRHIDQRKGKGHKEPLDVVRVLLLPNLLWPPIVHKASCHTIICQKTKTGTHWRSAAYRTLVSKGAVMTVGVQRRSKLKKKSVTRSRRAASACVAACTCDADECNHSDTLLGYQHSACHEPQILPSLLVYARM